MFQSLSRSEEKLVRGLHRAKIREAEGLLLAEGIRVVEDLVESGLPVRLAIVTDALEQTERGRALLAALEVRVPVRRVDDRLFQSLAATQSPQGVLAVGEVPRRELAGIVPRDAMTALILDGVQDPGNFGTLVRTADALGVDFVAALPGTVDPWNPKSIRASAGASFRVPIVRTGLDELMQWLRASGFTIYGSDAEGTTVEGAEPGERVALVVGNEGVGLGAETRRAVDGLLAVPIEPHAESLNVAVASGILLYLLTRRR